MSLDFRKLLRASLSIVLFLWMFLVTAGQIFASAGQVGTHVGYGDTTSQISTIEFVKGKSPPVNYPITVMVNLYAQHDEMQGLADSLNGGSFAVNIRILGITKATTEQHMRDFAAELAQVNLVQAKKPIVVVGNELNAYRGREWGDSNKPTSIEDAGSTYGPLLTALAESLDTKYDLAGVALDPYHEDLATTFIDSAAPSFYSTKVNSFATNVYQDVSSSDGLRKDLQAGLDLYDYLASAAPKQRKVFTEFGYKPTEKDVQTHLDFYRIYESTPLPGGFEYATALVPNLCSETVADANQWYFYVMGKIYNESLEEMDADCVPQTEGGDFIYPGPVDIFYNLGGAPQGRGAAMGDILANDYLLTCSPQIQFQPTLTPSNPNVVIPNLSGAPAVVSLLEHCGSREDNPRCLFNISNQTVSVIADQASVPLIRSSIPGRTGSFEGFFSSDTVGIDGSPGDAGSIALLTAPSIKLSPRDKVCRDNVSFLRAVSLTCDAIPPDDQGQITGNQRQAQEGYYASQQREFNECGLNTTLDGIHLKDIYANVSSITGAGNESAYCESEEFIRPFGEQLVLAKQVMNVQPVTPKAYRIGYLVVYIQGKEAERLSAEAMLTRITRPMDAGYLRDIFKIIPVLLPANFGTQKSDIVRDAQGVGIEGASFDGALKRTISPLVPREMREEIAEKAQDNKNEVRGKMTEFGGNTVNDGGMVWLPYCNNPLPYSSSGLNEEDTALNCYFADFINANLNIGDGNIIRHPEQAAPCRFYSDKAGGETAQQLNSPVKPEWMTTEMQAYQNGASSPSIKVNGQIYASSSQISAMINEEDAKMRVFLAVPEAEFGLIKDYEKYLLQTLLNKDAYELVLEDTADSTSYETNGFLRMLGVELRTEGSASKRFFTSVEDADAAEDDPGLPTLRFSDVLADFGLATGKDGANPVLWGGWLSKFVYAYTANIISSTGTKPFSPFDLTNRKLEPYWLNSTDPNDVGDGEEMLSCMTVWVNAATAQEHADALRASLPGQRALWASYFSGYRGEGNHLRQCNDGNDPDPADYGPTAIQYLFESIPECDGMPCYEYIIQRTLARSTADGRFVDPYITISIALNENGGLKTARLDKQSQHFGVVTPREGHVKECSDDNEFLGTIPEKLEIMLTTLLGDSGKTGVEALSEYGYANGGTAMVRLTTLLSNSSYTPSCAN